MRRTVGIGRVALAAAWILFGGRQAAAHDFRIAAWNVHEGFTAEGIRARAAELRRFAEQVRPDVLVLEEVTSPAVVAAVRDAMGLDGYYLACSDFTPTDEPDFTALEVAVLSKYPLTQVLEYDPTLDNDPAKGSPVELPIAANPKLGVAAPADVFGIRGFLWVRIEALKLTVVGVHLKSSRGDDGPADLGNAERREFVAAAIAESTAQDHRLFPEYTCVVAGDFNVGHSDPKNGRDLRRDDVIAGPGTDGYDETHALIGGGLAGVRMRNLMAHTDESTFPSFPSTPIDNIYVAGPAAERFDDAVAERETYGSDHRPIWSALHLAGAAPPVVPAPREVVKPVAPHVGTPIAAGPIVPLTELAGSIGKRCTVEFVVRSGTKLGNGRMAFLNSEANFRDAKNFTTVVGDAALRKFAAKGVADPSRHFFGKRIRVTGTASIRSGAHQIVIDDPAQIELAPAQ